MISDIFHQVSLVLSSQLWRCRTRHRASKTCAELQSRQIDRELSSLRRSAGVSEPWRLWRQSLAELVKHWQYFD